MSTSGTTDFALDAREIIIQAFTEAKIVSPGETPTADEMDDAMVRLNLLLKTWSAKAHLWIMTEGTQALTTGQAAYPITNARRMDSVRRRTSGIDVPLNPMSRQDYNDMPNKAGLGTPVSWYFDAQRSTRTLYVWPTAQAGVAANTVLHYTYFRVIEDIDALENDPDLPQEWLEALIYNLAVRLAGSYGSEDLQRLTVQAAALLAALSSQDQEDGSMFLQPEMRYGPQY